MHKLFKVACLALLCLASPILVSSAATDPSDPPPKPQFFAGTVTDLNPGHVTVSKTLFGRPTEIRTFLIDEKTKTSRTVKLRSRVTVRYVSTTDGDLAIEIQVRSQPKQPTKTS